MSPTSGPAMGQLVVSSDYDVVTIRQRVRQQARELGLGLIQQAKLASAISAVARHLLHDQPRAVFTIRTTQGLVPALEVICEVDLLAAVAPLATQLNDLRLLVDEADLAREQDHARLILRVWLSGACQTPVRRGYV